MKPHKLILASTSPSRKLLLERLKIPFECVAPNVDETPLPTEQPESMVIRLAKEKAFAVASQFPNSFIIGGDQVGLVDNEILGKPLTYEKAVKQLLQVSGKRIRFFIGICLLDTKQNHVETALETYDVIFRDLSLATIENYLKRESALNCAGSFTVEGLGISLVQKLEGDDYTALIGLPLIRLVSLFKKAGIA